MQIMILIFVCSIDIHFNDFFVDINSESHCLSYALLEKNELKKRDFCLLMKLKKMRMFCAGVEPATFCVLSRCDNRYTNRTTFNHSYSMFIIRIKLEINQCVYRIFFFRSLSLHSSVKIQVICVFTDY
jgi:hypothetical protein